MKIEIIFRGLTLDGKWKYGYYFRQGAFSFIQNEKGGNEAVLPESVGQSTGLLDSKGNRIFEGDILKINTAVCVGDFFEDGYEEDVPQEITCEVVYRTKNASFDLDTLESDTHLTGWGFYDGEGYTMEITGNIHEITPNK
ncbi:MULTISPECIES: YopX family protein [Elizabethkingia]|uniref:YopX family protein n=1 Tax=Elizabethkingia TaxID=308865 RepID=UPI001627F508|nr:MULTISPECIES: YopX family protein [Elizabethkingia]QNV11251.1 hypothetical protein EIY88_18770 [Elizabethkingia anophelis]UTF89404.1 hypothetical protein J2N93_18895 [Elizabethkingia anophelis]UTG53878.1 hypothetical protein J2O05_18880 [Elizabethkingia anophelis]